MASCTSARADAGARHATNTAATVSRRMEPPVYGRARTAPKHLVRRSGALQACQVPSALPEILDNLGKDVIERQSGAISNQSGDFREVRHPPRHVLEPGLVG